MRMDNNMVDIVRPVTAGGGKAAHKIGYVSLIAFGLKCLQHS